MSEMIERVARAILRAKGITYDCDVPPVVYAEARAAIAAMREPTWDMVSVAANIDLEVPRNDGFIGPVAAVAAWRVMIDEALAQGIVTEGEDALAASVSAAN